MNVAAYNRVSTNPQETERQRRDIGRWCAMHGHALIATYTDKASGLDTTRPERRCAIEQARKGEFSAIVVTELSRWSRSVPDLLSTLETLAADGVRLIAINGPDFDIAKPLGKMMLTVLGAVAEFERGLISERVKSGLETRKANGGHVGRMPGSDTKTRAVRAALERTDISGLSQLEAAKLLNCSKNTLRKALSAL